MQFSTSRGPLVLYWLTQTGSNYQIWRYDTLSSSMGVKRNLGILCNFIRDRVIGVLTILKSVLSIIVCPQIKKKVIIDKYDLNQYFFQIFMHRSLLRSLRPRSMNITPVCSLNHIKNMMEENLKHRVQNNQDTKTLIEKYDRVYKPTYTIEFNREGEVLLYSCDPLKWSEVYFKYPYILYESMIPASIWMWFNNPFEIAWYFNNAFFFLPHFLWTPRIWWLRQLSYKAHRMYLLRGGKVAHIQTTTLAGDRNDYYVEVYNFNPLSQDLKDYDDRDNADFLAEEGQLKYELGVQMDNFQDLGCNVQDEVIYFMKEGTVHHPELFEAVVKGYHVDTSDFVINTAHNRRSREGVHNL